MNEAFQRAQRDWAVSYNDGELYTRMYRAAHDGVLVAYLRGARCRTEADFFCEVSAALRFPYYFGDNWNAFDECMTDLDWQVFREIVFVVDRYSCIFGGSREMQEVLLRHLQYAVDAWRDAGIRMTVLLNR